MVRRFWVVLAWVCAAWPLWGEAPGPLAVDQRVVEARHLATELLHAAALPGFSVAVGVDGQVVWSEGFGLANLETPAPVTTTTRFRAASVSKVLTIAALARLEARGVVDLDAPIQRYLPDYPNKGPITLRLLAGHLAGIRHYLPKDAENDRRSWASLGEALAIFRDDPLVAPPGEKYHYSTFGYTLIGAALEAATGKGFLEILRDEVTGPLGLRQTGGDLRGELIPGRSAGYERGVDGQLRNIPADDPSYKWPGGGLLTTSEDLVLFGMAQLGESLQPAQRAKYFVSQQTRAGEPTGVGVGWRLGKDWRGRVVYHHAGSQAGARSVLILYPEAKVVVAVMTNLSFAPAGIEPTAQVLAEPFLPALPAAASAAEAPPGGIYTYRGTFRGEAAVGTLSLIEAGASRRGALSTPLPMALAFKLQGQPSPASLAILTSHPAGSLHGLILATPMGLLPMTFERGNEGWRGVLPMGGASLELVAQPLAPVLRPPPPAQP